MANKTDSKHNQADARVKQAAAKSKESIRRNTGSGKKKRKGKSEAEVGFVSQVFPDASDVWQELFRQAAKEFTED